MATAPLFAGLAIVVPIIRITGALGFLPAAFTFPLACNCRTELLIGRLCSGMKEFAAACTTPLLRTPILHGMPLFDWDRFREFWMKGLDRQPEDGFLQVGQKK